MRSIAIALAGSLISTPLAAQWLNQPTQGLPRSADGKPNLTAPAPRMSDGRPDLSGLWVMPFHPGYLVNIASDLESTDIQPWAAALFTERMADLSKDDPGTIGCLPLGPRAITGGAVVRMAKIVQTPTVIVVLHEDLTYRQIFMDGRALPTDPKPSFMGYSIGRWDGDELVVESVGFNAGTWLDFGGHPHTESLRITERYRRIDFGHVRREVTVIDPGTFNKSITVSSGLVLAADTELLEYVCAETPRDRFHLMGRTVEQQTMQIAPEILARYVGVYELEEAALFGIQILNISLSEGQLLVDFNGKGRIPLVPLSKTTFSPRLLGTYEFVTDDRGFVTHLLMHGVEGTSKAMRRSERPGR